MRTSRRTYKARALDKSILEVLKNMVDAVNEASGLEFQLVEDGTPAFKIFSGRFSYIAVCGEDSEAARVKSGYWGESIVLQCVYHGLGTCWVSGTYDENKVYKAIDLPKKHRLYAVIVVGYVKDKLSAKEKLMYNATHKNNKPYQKMFEVCDKKLPPYYEYAMKCKNKFVSSWFAFNLTMNNILVALTARKFKMDIAPLIVGDTEVCEALRTSGARDFGLTGEVDFLDQLVKISETEELVEREKKIDQLRWNWMEEATFFNYFTVERLFVFLLQLEMIERWISLDKEKGNQLFRSIIATLKDEVQIPAEFR